MNKKRNTDKDKSQKRENSVKINHSFFPLLTDVVPAEVFVLFVVAAAFYFYMTRQSNLMMLLVIAGIILFLVVNSIVFLSAYNWTNSFYKITKESVLYNQNRLFKKQKEFYTLNENADFKLRQSFMGRIFNFGTIDIVGPTIENKISIVKVQNPKRVMSELVDLVSKIDSGDVFVT